MVRIRQPRGHFLALVILTSLLIGLFPALAQDTSGTPDVPPFGTPGPYAVGYRQFMLDAADLPRTGSIWYPAIQPDGVAAAVTYDFGAGDFLPPEMNLLEGHALLDADPLLDGAPYPLIISSHGHTFSYFVSAYQFEHLASHGFVVYAFDHSYDPFRDLFMVPEQQLIAQTIDSMVMRLFDITAAIDFVEQLTAEGELAGLVDLEHIGVHGLSYGGYTAVMQTGVRFDFSAAQTYCAETTTFAGIAEAACDLYGEDIAALEAHLAELAGVDLAAGGWPSLADPRVDAAAALVPGGGLSLIADAGLAFGDKPLLMLVAGGERRFHEETSLRVWTHTVSSMEAMVIFDGAHHAFAMQCTPGMVENWRVCIEPIWETTIAYPLSNHFVTAFFRALLLDDAAARAALAADAVDFPDILYQARGF